MVEEAQSRERHHHAVLVGGSQHLVHPPGRLQPLADLGDAYVTVMYDHRGSGLTVCDPDTITFENLVSDAVAVLSAFGITRCARL